MSWIMNWDPYSNVDLACMVNLISSLAIGHIPDGAIVVNMDIESITYNVSDPIWQCIFTLTYQGCGPWSSYHPASAHGEFPVDLSLQMTIAQHVSHTLWLWGYQRTTSSLPDSLIFFPINLLTHSDLSPIELLIPGTTIGMMNEWRAFRFVIWWRLRKMCEKSERHIYICDVYRWRRCDKLD